MDIADGYFIQCFQVVEVCHILSVGLRIADDDKSALVASGAALSGVTLQTALSEKNKAIAAPPHECRSNAPGAVGGFKDIPYRGGNKRQRNAGNDAECYGKQPPWITPVLYVTPRNRRICGI